MKTKAQPRNANPWDRDRQRKHPIAISSSWRQQRCCARAYSGS